MQTSVGDSLPIASASEDGTGQTGNVKGRPTVALQPELFFGHQPAQYVRLSRGIR